VISQTCTRTLSTISHRLTVTLTHHREVSTAAQLHTCPQELDTQRQLRILRQDHMMLTLVTVILEHSSHTSSQKRSVHGLSVIEVIEAHSERTQVGIVGHLPYTIYYLTYNATVVIGRLASVPDV